MGKILNFCAAPFRGSAEINKGIILGYLKNLDGVFLEVGPGPAPLLAELHHIEKDKKILLDLPDGAKLCRNFGFKCLSQDAGTEKWQLKDASVDVVVSTQCLEHIPDTDHFISEAYRVLQEGGKLVLSVPNQAALAYIIMMLFTINPPMNTVSNRYYGLGNIFSSNRGVEKSQIAGYGHLRLFSTRAMNDLLTAYGFRVLKNHGGSWGTPILGKFLAGIFPYYGLFTTVLAEKI